jgi:thymidylate synthase
MDFPEFYTEPRGMKIHEIINCQLVITNPYLNLFKNPVRDVPYKYLANELILYFSGSCSAYKFTEASPFWGTIANDDGTINSAYGNLIFTEKDARWDTRPICQFDWALKSLVKDKDSRQAIMHYNKPQHMVDTVKDFPCTICNQFFIRNDMLYMTTYMRSNDLFLGLTYDIPFFTMLQQTMLLWLRDTYPDLSMGTYTHFDGSLHAYERDFDKLNEMSEAAFEEDCIPEIKENPIFAWPIMQMYENFDKYEGKDPFFKWIQKYR